MLSDRVLMLMGCAVMLISSTGNAIGAARTNHLIIDGTSYGKQIRKVSIGDLTNTVDVVTADAGARWITVNRAGNAVCLVGRGPAARLCRFAGLGKADAPLIVKAPAIARGYAGALSPDGTMLCFVGAGGKSIKVLELANGRVHGVFAVTGSVSEPSWSPDGKSVGYYFGGATSGVDDSFKVGISEHKKGKWIHRMVAPASKLGHRSPTRKHPPLWGPAGEVVVFEARYRNEERGAQTYVVRKDGTGRQRIAGFGSTPVASVSHGGIVYRDAKQGVFLFHVKTGKRKKLLDVKDIYWPTFSDDGALLAYSNGRGVIYVAASDGSKARQVFDFDAGIPVGGFWWFWVPGTSIAGVKEEG